MARSRERKKTRMERWDYSSVGLYFVTFCVKNRVRVFGNIREGKMILSEEGKIAHQYWKEIPDHFENIEIDQFIVMPDHIHGIVVIEDFPNLDRERRSAFPTNKIDRTKMKLSKIIHGFKSSVTRKINKQSPYHFTWQSSFHDHVIRNKKELENIQKYIHFNAAKERDDIS